MKTTYLLLILIAIIGLLFFSPKKKDLELEIIKSNLISHKKYSFTVSIKNNSSENFAIYNDETRCGWFLWTFKFHDTNGAIVNICRYPPNYEALPRQTPDKTPPIIIPAKGKTEITFDLNDCTWNMPWPNIATGNIKGITIALDVSNTHFVKNGNLPCFVELNKRIYWTGHTESNIFLIKEDDRFKISSFDAPF